MHNLILSRGMSETDLSKRKIKFKRPMLVVGVLIFLSFFISYRCGVSEQLIIAGILAFLSMISWLLKKYIKIQNFWIFLFIAAFAFLYFSAYTLIAYQPIISHANSYASLTGVVTEIDRTSAKNVRYTLKIKQINQDSFYIPTQATINVGSELDVTYGDVVTVPATWESAAKNQMPGLTDEYQSKGIFLNAYLNQDALNSLTVRHPAIKSPASYCKILRDKLMDIIDTYVQYPYGYLVDGMLFGKKNNIPFDIIENFRGAGFSHLLAVSGLHVSIVSSILLAVLSFLKLSQKTTAIINICFLFIFAAMAGFSPSIIRSCIMVFLGMSYPFFFRKADPLNSLAIAATAILLFSPYAIANISFLLSFSATLGILVLSPILLRFFHNHQKNSVLYYIYQSFCVSLSATVFTIPISLTSFSQTSIIAPISNLFASPLAGVILFSALLTIILSLICPPLASFTGNLTSFVCILLNKIAAMFNEVPYTKISINDTVTCCFGILAFLLFFIWSFSKKSKITLGIICILLSGLLILSSFGSTWYHQEDTVLTVLGNNSGYSIIVSYKKHACIIGCGSNSYSGQNTYNYLTSHGIKQIDFMILPTLQKKDACGASFLLDHFKTQEIISPDHGMMYSPVYTAASQRQTQLLPLQDMEIDSDYYHIKINDSENKPLFSVHTNHLSLFYSQNSKNLIDISPESDDVIRITPDSAYLSQMIENGGDVIALTNDIKSSDHLLCIPPQEQKSLLWSHQKLTIK